jgi:serine phosphatase RsbU (regulator of sigma subunit)
VPAPLYLRGRAIGLLLAVRSPQEPLARLARQAAAALELARAYTDVFDLARRRKDTSAAAEVQQATLPPRIARISGATLAGNVLPSYNVGGDWFDYVENPGGTWLGIADAIGNGATAAALGAIALGAFRAARRTHEDLRQIVISMHETLGQVGGADDSVAVTIARWHGASSTLSWISCGNPHPMRIDSAGRLEALGSQSPPLGTPQAHAFTVERTRLSPGERIILASDGILERPTGHDTHFGTDGIRQAVLDVAPTSAAGTVKTIEDAVLSANPQPLEDDATLIVLAPSDTPAP